MTFKRYNMSVKKLPNMNSNALWLFLFCSSTLLSLLAELIRERSGLKVSVYLGIVFLLMTLLPVNILAFLPSSLPQSLRSILNKMIANRRSLGITAGLLFILHALLSILTYGSFTPQFMFSKNIVLGTISMYIFMIILMTSNQAAQKFLRRRWKSIQLLVWLTPPLILAHSFLATWDFDGELTKVGLIAFGSLTLMPFVELALHAIRRKNPNIPIYNLKWSHAGLVLTGITVAALILSLFKK